MTTSNVPAPDDPRVPVPPPVGRALLTWEGKRRPATVPLRTLRVCEAFGAQSDDPGAGRLFHGDNLSMLAHLLDRGLAGQVRLIYIDPPFDSGADYTRKVRLRDAQGHHLGATVEYTDIWPGDSYLQFMYARLLLLWPSMCFWPSSLGKDSWMLFTIGIAAYVVAAAVSTALLRAVGRFPWWAGFAAPALAGGFVVLVVWSAARRALGRPSTWRGRVVASR